MNVGWISVLLDKLPSKNRLRMSPFLSAPSISYADALGLRDGELRCRLSIGASRSPRRYTSLTASAIVMRFKRLGEVHHIVAVCHWCDGAEHFLRDVGGRMIFGKIHHAVVVGVRLIELHQW